MGKDKRLKGKRRRVGAGVCADLSARLTETFQRELRRSELWDQMVAEFGEARAEEILRECTAEGQAGFTTHEPGDRPADLP
jgi:hypothetical protein